ncbi:MAG: CRISPR-associated protein Cas5 [Candidatus Dojkabacteria bacterium]
MEKVIRFKVSGLLNSFKYQEYRSYQPTYLAPPKTTLWGLIANLLSLGEKESYKIFSENKIEVAVIIEEIAGETKDLWKFKNVDKEGSITRRHKLYRSAYWIYLKTGSDFLYQDKLLSVLQNPPNVFSLGMDDEVAYISDVGIVEVVPIVREDIEIHSIFREMPYKTFIKSRAGETIVFPRRVNQYINFSVPFDDMGRRVQRKGLDSVDLIEFYGCKVVLEETTKCWVDKTDASSEKNIIFY